MQLHLTTALSCLTLLLLAAPIAARGPETWRLDPVHSQVVFFADHLGLSHGIGRVKVRDGWLRFDPDDWSTAQVDVSVDVASLDMGEAKWTKAVLGQFLDATRWPTARFVSSAVEKIAARSGIVRGTLTLRGVSKPVALELTFNGRANDPYAFKTKAGFTARTTLDRFEFGMQRYRDVVGAEVELRIEVEAIRDKNAANEETTNATEEH